MGHQISIEQYLADEAASQTQGRELARVSQKIAHLVLAFCDRLLNDGRPEFHMADLERYVADRMPVAPGSAGRILRDLAHLGVVSYAVLNRRQSLYAIVGLDRSKLAS